MDRVFQKKTVKKSLSRLRVWMIVVPVPRVVMVLAYKSCLELRFGLMVACQWMKALPWVGRDLS